SRLSGILGSTDDRCDNCLKIQFAELVPLIEDENAGIRVARHMPAATSNAKELNAFKDRQLFFIDVRHLLQADATPFEFSTSLTDLAETVIAEAAGIGLARVAAKFGEP